MTETVRVGRRPLAVSTVQHDALHLGGVEHEHRAPAGTLAADLEQLRADVREAAAPTVRALEEFVAGLTRLLARARR